MKPSIQKPDPLIELIDGIARLQGRLKGAFAEARRLVGLGETEMTVLNAVAEATAPPTVPQIGRSLGHPRQVIQRAANALIAAGLIEARNNPDHKRAVLLVPTPRGQQLKRDANTRAAQISESLRAAVDDQVLAEAAARIEAIRHRLDAHLRMRKD